MRISKGFIKSSLTYTVAGALPLASGFILLPFYILYLPTEVLGTLAICTSISALVQIVASYSFDTSIYIHYHELKHDREKLSAFISGSFIFILALGGVTLLLSFIAGHLLFSEIYPDSTLAFYPYGLMAVAVGVLQAIFKVHANFLQTREKHETFFWANVVFFVVIMSATIVGLKAFPETLVGPMGARLLAGSGAAVWVLFRVFREFGFHVKSPWRDTSFSFNVYTFIYQMQQWVINSSHPLIIAAFMPHGGMAAVGIFDLAMKCMAPLELLLNGLNATINPKIIQLLVKQPEPKTSTPDINRYFYGLVAVMLIATCGAVFLFPFPIDWFLAGTRYQQALIYLPYVGVIFVAKAVRLYFVVPFTTLKKMRTLMTLNFVVAVLKVIVMILLIQQFGIYGVIMATILVFAFELILLWKYLEEYYQMKFNFFKLIGVPYLMIFAILTTEWTLPADLAIFARAGYCAVTFMLLIVAYRKEIRMLNLFKMIR